MRTFVAQPKSTKISRIVFWDPCTSPHKADFFESLARCSPDIDLICCAQNNLLEERKALGWTVKSSVCYRTIIAPSLIEINHLVDDEIYSTLHVFSGIRHVPIIIAGLKAVRKSGARFAIWHEPRVREGWKGDVRFVQSWLVEGWLRKHVEFVLAIGRNGPPWFISTGYPPDRVFPFAYFVDPPKLRVDHPSLAIAAIRPVQVGYVGRLVKMKGVFQLVAAAAQLGQSAHLSIVGSGPDEQALKVTSADLQLDVDFLGVLPIYEVGEFMRQLDVLVLASISNDDGWGVVVSEALMSGTAVVATSCVGASIVLDNPLLGKCVPAKSPLDIARAVTDLQLEGAYSSAKRIQRAAVARQCLSAEAGARHFLEIIQWRFAGAARPVSFDKNLG